MELNKALVIAVRHFLGYTTESTQEERDDAHKRLKHTDGKAFIEALNTGSVPVTANDYVEVGSTEQGRRVMFHKDTTIREMMAMGLKWRPIQSNGE